MEQYVSNLQKFPGAGIQFAGWVDSGGMAERYGVKAVGSDLENYIREVKPDTIVVNYEAEETHHLHGRLKELHNDVVPIVILPDLTYSFIGFETEQVAGVPALILNQPNFSTAAIVTKRAFDAVACGLGLLVISPFLLAIAIGVKLSSPGPIFFGQERVGLDGRRFKMWKFRSMRVGSHESNGVPGWTQENDPRRTKFGTFLRSTSLDELPQLWNVFVGEMSLVGPRPEQPYYVDKFRGEIPAYMLRHKMKAGITGWAQVNGWRGDTSLHKRIECDLYYIRNWSLWLDIKILFLTLYKGLISKNAY
jgi:putative colanic acid biosynthesis UDP-glucose lipid carrier transferase